MKVKILNEQDCTQKKIAYYIFKMWVYIKTKYHNGLCKMSLSKVGNLFDSLTTWD